MLAPLTFVLLICSVASIPRFYNDEDIDNIVSLVKRNQAFLKPRAGRDFIRPPRMGRRGIEESDEDENQDSFLHMLKKEILKGINQKRNWMPPRLGKNWYKNLGKSKSRISGKRDRSAYQNAFLHSLATKKDLYEDLLNASEKDDEKEQLAFLHETKRNSLTSFCNPSDRKCHELLAKLQRVMKTLIELKKSGEDEPEWD